MSGTVVAVRDVMRQTPGAVALDARPARVRDDVVVATARRLWPDGFDERHKHMVHEVLHAAAAEGFEFGWVDVAVPGS